MKTVLYIISVIISGVDFEFIAISVLIWVIMGGSIFLLIGAVQGSLTSWFIGNEIEKRKTHYNSK